MFSLVYFVIKPSNICGATIVLIYFVSFFTSYFLLLVLILDFTRVVEHLESFTNGIRVTRSIKNKVENENNPGDAIRLEEEHLLFCALVESPLRLDLVSISSCVSHLPVYTREKIKPKVFQRHNESTPLKDSDVYKRVLYRGEVKHTTNSSSLLFSH